MAERESEFIEKVGEVEFKPILEFEKALCANGASYVNEVLQNRVKHETFLKLLDSAEFIYYFDEDRNLYGDFLFVGLALRYNERLIGVTFYGLGLHEMREEYITDYWFFYWSNDFELEKRVNMSKEEIKAIIEQKREEIKRLAKDHEQTEKGELFTAIAELTDEDGAYSLMQEMDLF